MHVLGWILLSILALILLLLFLPVGVRVEYIGAWKGQVLLFGVIPVFSFSALSGKEDKKSPAPSVETVQTSSEKQASPILDELKLLYRQDGVSGVAAFFKQLMVIIGGTLRRVVRFITIRKLALCVRVGGDEVNDIAVNYGRMTAVFYPTLTALSHMIRIRQKTVLIKPDFIADQSDVKLRMIVWVWPFGVLFEGVRALIKFVAVWIKTFHTNPVKKPLS